MPESYGLWEVGGSFVLPGTRNKVTLPFILIGDFTKQAASKALAPILRDKFAKDLIGRGGHPIGSFGDNWALMNLVWRNYQPKVPIQVNHNLRAEEIASDGDDGLDDDLLQVPS